MAAVKKKLGRCMCPICLLKGKKNPIMLKENEAGTVTWNCDECDAVGFSKRGTEGANILRESAGAAVTVPVVPAPGTAKPVPAAPAPATAKPVPANTAPVPVKRKAATPFDFLGA